MERAQRSLLHQPPARGVPRLSKIRARRLHQARERDARRAGPGSADGRRRACWADQRAQVRHLDQSCTTGCPTTSSATPRLRPAPVRRARRRRRRRGPGRRAGESSTSAVRARQADWVTETGVGGRDVGDERSPKAKAIRADCQALNVALRRWNDDPRVDAASIHRPRRPRVPGRPRGHKPTHPWPAYDLLKASSGDRQPDGPAPRRPRPATRERHLRRAPLARPLRRPGQPAEIEPDHPSALAMFAATARRRPTPSPSTTATGAHHGRSTSCQARTRRRSPSVASGAATASRSTCRASPSSSSCAGGLEAGRDRGTGRPDSQGARGAHAGRGLRAGGLSSASLFFFLSSIGESTSPRGGSARARPRRPGSARSGPRTRTTSPS